MDMQINQSGVVGVRPARSSPRLNGACRALLGEDFNYAGGDGHYYVGDTSWCGAKPGIGMS